VRGHELWNSAKSRVLRLELEVPSGEGIVLGDLFVDGSPLRYGGQLAQLLSVHLFVTRWPRTDNSIGPVVGCDATCCRRIGTQELGINPSGKCPQGYELAFDDLVSPEPISPVSLEVAESHAMSIAAVASRMTNRRLP
jgi:hypothetical protein